VYRIDGLGEGQWRPCLGRLKIGEVFFRWEFSFVFPVWEIEKIGQGEIVFTARGPKRVMDVVDVRIWQGGVKITLLNEEHNFFVSLLAPLLLDFCRGKAKIDKGSCEGCMFFSVSLNFCKTLQRRFDCCFLD
jgi:hypothetical protein